MLVIDGMGPQESASSGYPRTYDHPYFGQLLLGGILKLIGYPNLYYSEISVHSIEILHLIPRLVVGILSVLDTYLLCKITEVRYSRKIALIAAILFAVMPMTWIFRRVLLDTLLMPFFLSSILFALCWETRKNRVDLFKQYQQKGPDLAFWLIFGSRHLHKGSYIYIYTTSWGHHLL